MDPETRRAWLEVVSGDDYDQHMATIGQAQVNASLVCQMLGDHPLAPGARLLFVGCGTGQTLDFADLDEFRRFTITFSDINPEFLAKLEERLRRNGLEALVVQDDLTSTQLAERFDAVVTVLVLEHIDWKVGVDTILGYGPRYLHFIIQQQEPEAAEFSLARELPPSIREFKSVARPKLVSRADLQSYLERRGVSLARVYERPVPDAKTMVGLVFVPQSDSRRSSRRQRT